MDAIIGVLGGFGSPPAVVLMFRMANRLPLRSPHFYGMWATGAAVGCACMLVIQAWSVAIGDAASVVLALILWWWSRRKRKRSLRALGSKARARLAAMARNMPKPGPALKPVPQGAAS